MDELPKTKKGKKIIHKIKHKSRLVVMNDDTFEEHFSMVLSPLNVFTYGGLFLVVFALVLIFVIAFTPLRELIPGYSDVNTRKLASYAAVRVDSMQHKMERDSLYLENIKMILNGEDGLQPSEDSNQSQVTADMSQVDLSASREDLELRQMVEEEERFNVHQEEHEGGQTLSRALLFPPIKGIITSHFNPALKHYGVDVVPTAENASVSATYDGVVIQSAWTSGEGHVMYIQHSGDLISVYKHNALLLKKVGASVKAGEAIAIVGNSGELSSGPHLHFELWYKGAPTDPENYLVF